jgi:hypothetical protein
MVFVMKISIFAALLLLGTELMARATVQGVEQAIVSRCRAGDCFDCDRMEREASKSGA